MNELVEAAMHYRELGLSVIATDALKQSLVKWKKFQHKPATDKQLLWMFDHSAAHSLAVVTGKVSGNLEVIDIDAKYDLEGKLLERLLLEIEEFTGDLSKDLVIAQSRSGGYHLYYRCSEIEQNQALARRPVTDEEKACHPMEKVKVLIETRAEGGYVIVPPSPGYRFLQHDFTKIPVITPENRYCILEAARSFNKYQEKKIEWRPRKTRPAGVLSPLDDYNLRGDVIELLQKHGWTIAKETPKRTTFKRPGDTDKRSSGSINHDMNCFSVFTTSTQFKPKKKYLFYAVYAELECNGDFKEAVKRLAREGYGQQSTHQIQKSDGYKR